MSLAAGTRLGPYVIGDRIGSGGMGAVYDARDARLDRSVAVKVLPDELATDDERRARFEREAKTVAALNHPGIVTIHSVEQIDGVHLIVMERIEGETLDARIPDDGMELDDNVPVIVPRPANGPIGPVRARLAARTSASVRVTRLAPAFGSNVKDSSANFGNVFQCSGSKWTSWSTSSKRSLGESR